jgi:cyanobactin maturation PatA/PatG family protease
MPDEATDSHHTPETIPIEGLESLWAETLGDPAITIAVLDGPVDLAHPCFAGADLTPLETLVPGAAAPGGAASAHGTHVASVLFGQPGSEVHGIAPRCRGLILPVFSDQGGGSTVSCSQLDLARAITQALAGGAQVINISGGEITPSGAATPLLANAVRLCAENNVLIVAAVGNEGCECLHVPAALPLVLAVGAMDSHGNPFEFSNWGAAYRAQGLLAPGEKIIGAAPGGGTVAKTGTSFATPIVSGIVALLLSLQFKQGQTPNPQQVREILLDTATPCDPVTVMKCGPFLRGRLDPVKARQAIVQEETIAVQPAAQEERTETVNNQAAACSILAEDPTGLPVEASLSSQVAVAAPQQPAAHIIPVEGDSVAIETHFKTQQRRETMSDQTRPGEAQPAVDQPIEDQGQRVETGHRPATGQPEAPPPPAFVGTSSRPEPGPAIRPSQIRPAQAESGSLVFGMGTLGYDFGTEARRDWFAERLSARNAVPENQEVMLEYFETGLREGDQAVNRAYAATSLIWTLNLDATPIYAIQPAGPFAAEVYDTLRAYLRSQLEAERAASDRAGADQAVRDSTRVSVPGVIEGSVALRSGQVVPVITPERRGMAQVRAIADTADDQERLDQLMSRLFYELRNLGVAPQERAINAMATYGITGIRTALEEQRREIESVMVEKTPVCRPGSDCWDVVITAFDPTQVLTTAKTVLRQTVDVSDVVPVRLGRLRVFSTL